MFTKLQEFFGMKKKPKYKAKNFTKSRVNSSGNREVYDSISDQWLVWLMIMDDTDYEVDFNSFEEVGYTEDNSIKSSEIGRESVTSLETYIPTSYEPSSSSSSSSSYDSGSSYSSSSYDSSSSSSSSGGCDLL